MRYILRGGYVVTMDEERATFPAGYVAVADDGRIAGVGPMETCPEAGAAEVIDCTGRMVVPGLIDTLHSHWTHLFPGMNPPDALATAMSLEAHALAAEIAASALVAGGVTAALNVMPAIAPDAARAAAAAMRRNGLLVTHAMPAAALDETLAADLGAVAVTQRSDALGLATGVLAEADICKGTELARQLGARILTRVAPRGESEADQRSAIARLGHSTIVRLMELGLLDDRWLVVCGEPVDDTDRALIRESGCHVVCAPVADAMAGTGSAALAALAGAGVNCALGTDGPGRVWTTDMLEQMKAAVITQNTLRLDPTVMSSERALEMATINAARALGLETQTGSLETGKRADIAVFDMRQPKFKATVKPLSVFIACARACDAERVLIDGRMVIGEGAPPRGPADVTAAAAARAAALQSVAQRRGVRSPTCAM